MLIVLAIASLVFIYSTFNPESSKWFPKCIFLLLTGLKCPGCGSQRAIHHLLNLDIIAALQYNALVVIMLPLLFLYGVDYMSGFKFHKLHNLLNSHILIVSVGIIVALWFIIRNLFNM